MTSLTTQRLLLVPATVRLAAAEIENQDELWKLLGSDYPSAWPPPLNDQDSMKWYADFLAAHPGAVGWGLWYFLLKRPDQPPLPIGNGGFKGLPAADGTAEVGYSILAEHQRQGLAPEAVRALLGWAFSHSHVSRVVAHTLPDLTPSLRVLEKCGFRFVGEGTEEGAILYELRREEFSAGDPERHETAPEPPLQHQDRSRSTDRDGPEREGFQGTGQAQKQAPISQ